MHVAAASQDNHAWIQPVWDRCGYGERQAGGRGCLGRGQGRGRRNYNWGRRERRRGRSAVEWIHGAKRDVGRPVV